MVWVDVQSPWNDFRFRFFSNDNVYIRFQLHATGSSQKWMAVSRSEWVDTLVYAIVETIKSTMQLVSAPKRT